MGKYEPLQRYLESLDSDSWHASLADIERILGFGLPKSAYRYYAWWANETSGSHSHAKSWQEAGWNTRDVNLEDNCLRFERVARAFRGSAPTESTTRKIDARFDDLDSLADLAGRILGITDQDKIVRIALESLIRRSVGKELISLGGTMPDLQVPERERPVI